MGFWICLFVLSTPIKDKQDITASRRGYMKYVFLFASSYASKSVKGGTVTPGKENFDGVVNLKNGFRFH